MNLLFFICNEFNIKPYQVSTYLQGVDFKRNVENVLKLYPLKTSIFGTDDRFLKMAGLSPKSATIEQAYLGQNWLSLAAYHKLKNNVQLKYPHAGIIYGFINDNPVAYPLELVAVCRHN